VCQRDFRQAHGAAIPREPSDPHWDLYGRFRHDRSLAMIERVGRFIAERLPGAKVGFNQVGTVRFPEPMPSGISCLTLDFTTSTPQSLQASLCAAYGSTADLPADVMNTIFNQGWGDWSPRPAAALEQEAAAVWARGCLPVVGDRLHPANRFDPATVNAMRIVARVARRMAREYPADDARVRPDVLVLHGPAAMYGPDWSRFAIGRDGMRPLEGAHRLLLDAGWNMAIASEHVIEKALDGVRLAVLPELPAIAEATAAALQRFVTGGGQVLVVGRVPTVGGAPLGWVNVRRAESPWQDHVYLPAWGRGDGDPVLVRGDFRCVEAVGAETVMTAIRPYDCDHGVRFGWGIGPASGEPSACPALVRHRLGDGWVWYLEPALFSDYDTHGNWTQIGWFRALLRRIVPAPTVEVESAAGSVEAVAHVNARTTWVFLLNHGGEQLVGNQRWARTFAPPPAYPITVRVRDAAGRAPRAVSVAGRPARSAVRDGAVTVSLRLAAFWRILRVDWE
jgi:hypothetical protein